MRSFGMFGKKKNVQQEPLQPEPLQPESIEEPEIFSIHDTWVTGSKMGDVDDLAAIFYLAKTYSNKTVVIYIINDAEKDNGTKISKVEKFVESYGKKLFELCPKMIIFGIGIDDFGIGTFIKKYSSKKTSNYSCLEPYDKEMYEYLKQSKKVVICAPVHSSRDPHLHKYLNTITITNLYAQSDLVSGYNFTGSDLTKDPKKNTIGKSNIKCYPTGITNRRLLPDQLDTLIGDPEIKKMMIKYGVMKTICLPPYAVVMSLYVSKNELNHDNPTKYPIDEETKAVVMEIDGVRKPLIGANTGNNATGLIIFNKPANVSEYVIQRPHSIIKEYFGDDTKRDEKLSTNPVVEQFMQRIIDMNKGADPDIVERFKYAMAYVCVCIEDWLPKMKEFYTLGSFSESPFYNDLAIDKVQRTSPMWDLIAMYYIVHNIEPSFLIKVEQDNILLENTSLTDTETGKEIWNNIKKNIGVTTPNVPKPKGTSFGGYSKKRKHRRKVTTRRRKPKTRNKRMRHNRR